MITKKCFDKKRIRPQHYLTPDNKGFTGILVVFYVFFITASFSDAEMLEDILEHIVSSDFTNDVTEVIDAFADIL